VSSGGSVPALRPPPTDGVEVATYVANPRAKRAFHTILDASRLFDKDSRSTVTTRVHRDAGERRVDIKTEHALKGGAISETLQLSGGADMRAISLERRLVDHEGQTTREEKVSFQRGPLPLPEATYPEVMLPFVLRWQREGERRAVYAWSVDRFVARVYCEWVGRTTLHVPAGRIDVLEMIMYPDLNDWVSLGAVLNSLAKPLLPKYRMWFEAAETRRVVRFEGPYGPPGAPEIVLELA
jgi:hypothetical protein